MFIRVVTREEGADIHFTTNSITMEIVYCWKDFIVWMRNVDNCERRKNEDRRLTECGGTEGR